MLVKWTRTPARPGTRSSSTHGAGPSTLLCGCGPPWSDSSSITSGPTSSTVAGTPSTKGRVGDDALAGQRGGAVDFLAPRGEGEQKRSQIPGDALQELPVDAVEGPPLGLRFHGDDVVGLRQAGLRQA